MSGLYSLLFGELVAPDWSQMPLPIAVTVLPLVIITPVALLVQDSSSSVSLGQTLIFLVRFAITVHLLFLDDLTCPLSVGAHGQYLKSTPVVVVRTKGSFLFLNRDTTVVQLYGPGQGLPKPSETWLLCVAH